MLQELLSSGLAAPVTVYAAGESDSSVPLAEGKLSLIDNQVSSTTGTVRAKARFGNPNLRLWPGQLVNVRLQTQLHRGALLAPSAVVQRGLEGTYVYRVADSKAQPVPVKVIDERQGQVVLAGVSAGDILVSDGQSRLVPGTFVQVITQPDAWDAAKVTP